MRLFNNTIVFILLLFIISCTKSSSKLVGLNYSINISTNYCPTIYCDEIQPVGDLLVSVYETESAAVDAINEIYKSETNEDGISNLDFTSEQAKVFIRVEHPNKGVFIENCVYNESLEAKKIDILYKGNMVYKYSNQLELEQDHISWSAPTVGQISNYKYYQKNMILDISTQSEYVDINLEVNIIDQLAENIFLIEETIDSLNPELKHRYDYIHQNVWEFKEQGILIHENFVAVDKVFSFILYQHSNSGGADSTFYFDYTDCDPNLVNLDEDQFYEHSWWDCIGVEDYTLMGTDYDLLRTQFETDIATDGDARIKLYNKENGIVRMIGLNQMGGLSFGFDLDLNE